MMKTWNGIEIRLGFRVGTSLTIWHNFNARERERIVKKGVGGTKPHIPFPHTGANYVFRLISHISSSLWLIWRRETRWCANKCPLPLHLSLYFDEQLAHTHTFKLTSFNGPYFIWWPRWWRKDTFIPLAFLERGRGNRRLQTTKAMSHQTPNYSVDFKRQGVPV